MSCDKGSYFWGDGTYEFPGAFGGCHVKKDSSGAVIGTETYYNWTTIALTVLLCLLCLCCVSVLLYALTQGPSY